MNLSQLQQLAVSAGFPNPNLAAAVAMGESGGNPSATNIVTDPAPGNQPERSFGLWQINTLAHPQYDETSLLDPTYNAQAAYAVSSGGTNWHPWTVYNTGAYKRWYSSPGGLMASITTGKALLIGAAVVGAAGIGYVMLSKPARRASYARENPVRRLGPHGGVTNVQSLLFARPKYSPSSAKAWARRNGFRYGSVDVTDRYVRLRQTSPGRYRRMRTKSFGHGIKAVIGVR